MEPEARRPRQRDMQAHRLPVILAALVAFVLAGCTAAASPTDSGGGVASPSPSAGASPASLSTAALKYRLIDSVGQPWFCDPDFYPIGREDESKLAADAFAGIRADTPTFTAIVARLGLDPVAAFDSTRELAVYRAWKVLRAIQLQAVAGGWSFDVAIATKSQPDSGDRVAGTIAPDGSIHVTSRTPAGFLTCPICLARGTPIATPRGPVAVESLRLGDTIWTLDAGGRRILGTVAAVGSTPVPTTHHVVHLVLSDGRALDASPGHPLFDGRLLGSLSPGDVVDGAIVLAAGLVTYAGGATFDLLASGPTGAYLADWIPLGSTIRR